MKKKSFISKAVKIIAFCLVFTYLFNYSYKVLSWKDGSGGYDSSLTTLYNEFDEDLTDVVFLGSSHCYCSISNAQLWNEHGMGAFSMVISGQDMASTYYCMDELLKTQTPEVICVELYGIAFDKHLVTSNIYRNTLGFKYSKNFLGIVDAIVPEEDKEDYLLKWPIIHTRYRELQKNDFVPSYPVYLGGNADSKIVEDVGELYIYNGQETLPVSETNRQWVQKIIDLAEEKDSELVFFIVPFVADENMQKQFRYIENFITEQGIPVINYFDKTEEISFDPHTDFLDAAHLNNNGAKKITAHIGKYLKKNYDLPDRSSDERYKIWEENSIYLAHKQSAEELNKISDIEQYFKKLSQIENCTIVIVSNGNNFIDAETDISDCFELVGIDSSFATSGGACIVNNGETEYITNEKNFSYYYDMTDDVVSLNGNNNINSITINRSAKKMMNEGFTVVVYDNVLRSTIDCIGFNATKHYDGDR